jgi:hypothetical protein
MTEEIKNKRKLNKNDGKKMENKIGKVPTKATIFNMMNRSTQRIESS